MSRNAESAEPLLAVVVLTWNDTAMTRRCLKHIFESTYSNKRVILVDNGSRDPCGRELTNEFPDVELIELPRNQGFAGGGNVGLRRALETNAKFVLHLNNDAFLKRNALTELVAALEARPDAGISHALLLYPDEDRVQFYNATIDRDLARHEHHHVGEKFSSRDWPTIESPFVPACVIVYRAEALKSVGLYDERFGTSWEDYDLCLRFSDAGWRILAVGHAVAEHCSGQTTGRKSAYIVYHMTRNRLACIQRYANRRRLLMSIPTLLRSFVWEIRAYGLTNWSGHRSFLLGTWDFLCGNFGERSSFTKRETAKRPAEFG